MRKHWIKTIVCMSLCALFCGCTPLPPARNKEPQNIELTLSIPQDSSSFLLEVVRELARRTEDFSNNELVVEILPQTDQITAWKQGTVDLAVIPNETLATENNVFTLLEQPYLFQDADYMISGVNHQEVIDAINYHLREDCMMDLERVAFFGFYDFAGAKKEKVTWSENSSSPLRISVSKELWEPAMIEEWNVLLSQNKDPIKRLEDERVDLAEVDIAVDMDRMEGKKLYLSNHRMKLLDFFIHPDTMQSLTPEQQAAIQEAVIYATGYAKTLAYADRQQTLIALENKNIKIETINSKRYFRICEQYYQAKTQWEYKELYQLLLDAAQETD